MSENLKSSLVWLLMLLIIAFAVYQMTSPENFVYPLPASEFYRYVGRSDSIHQFNGSLRIGREELKGQFKNPELIRTELTGRGYSEAQFPENWKGDFRISRDLYSNYPLREALLRSGIPFDNEPSSSFPQWLVVFGTTILPIIFFIGIMVFISRQMQGAGNKALSFGKSKAKLHSDELPKKTFNDVAGCDEAKDALEEVIMFLKDPKKFQRLGGRIPKGILLMGPPGTGKTLLARAVAGEAEVPFYSISGSDFVEMFVGVGASRVRDLFETGKKHAPCIIFIDELDAVGRHRGAGIGGGHDEREQTLNQLLVEMDGFDTSDGVILVAATNRPDVLDPALLRPGRFDRQIVVDLPDLRGREEILKVHTAHPFKMAEGVDLNTLARGTPYFSGADVANMVNEAALLAAKKDKNSVDQESFEEAKDRVMMGPERRSMAISEREKKITAYHEAGHALLNHFLPESDPNYKCSIIPRGRALGVTVKLPMEERHNFGKKYLLAEIVVLLGGRIAEEIMFGDPTTGAQNDFERATDLARKMVTMWGMSKLGPMTFGKNDGQVFLGKDMAHQKNYSEKTAIEVDQAVRGIITDCYNRAKSMIEAEIDGLKRLAEGLLDRETLVREEIELILGDSSKTIEIRKLLKLLEKIRSSEE